MGDNPQLRKSLIDISIAVDGNFRFELLGNKEFESWHPFGYYLYLYLF